MFFADDYSQWSQLKKKIASAKDLNLSTVPVGVIKTSTKLVGVECIYSSTATEDPNFVA